MSRVDIPPQTQPFRPPAPKCSQMSGARRLAWGARTPAESQSIVIRARELSTPSLGAGVHASQEAEPEQVNGVVIARTHRTGSSKPRSGVDGRRSAAGSFPSMLAARTVRPPNYTENTSFSRAATSTTEYQRHISKDRDRTTSTGLDCRATRCPDGLARRAGTMAK